jgi:hypothetical protein
LGALKNRFPAVGFASIGEPKLIVLGRVVGYVGWDACLSLAITVVVIDRNSWPIQGFLLEVRLSIPVQLNIQIGVEAVLENWIICEVDTTDDRPGLEL